MGSGNKNKSAVEKYSEWRDKQLIQAEKNRAGADQRYANIKKPDFPKSSEAWKKKVSEKPDENKFPKLSKWMQTAVGGFAKAIAGIGGEIRQPTDTNDIHINASDSNRGHENSLDPIPDDEYLQILEKKATAKEKLK
jgi:hypothetical protein